MCGFGGFSGSGGFDPGGDGSGRRGFGDLTLGSLRHSLCVPRHDLMEETLTRSVIGAFFEVYNNLGFGFLEHLYVMALERELMARGHRVARKVWVRVTYKGVGLLLHFGPKASFRREICPNTKSNRSNPLNPPNPHNPRS